MFGSTIGREFGFLAPPVAGNFPFMITCRFADGVSSTAHVPKAAAKIVFDRYHIMTHVTKAVDQVRKAEHRRLQEQERHWRQWYFWAAHSRLPAVLKAARTVERHRANVMTYFDHRITNAVSEGLNSKIQTVKKTPTDFATASTSKRPFTFTVEGSISTRKITDKSN